MNVSRAVLAGFFFVGAVSCVSSAPDEGPAPSVFAPPSRDPAMAVQRSETAISGVLREDGEEITFSSVEASSGVVDVKIELHGMILSARLTPDSATFDGVAADDGAPTIMTDVDRAAVKRLLAGIEAELFPPIDHVTSKADYDAARRQTLAEEKLFRVVDSLWSKWPSATPLTRAVGDVAHGWTSWRKYASTNTTVTGCHDCNVCAWSGDCCDTGKKLGEYFKDPNYGNCGTSNTGSQFTKDCTNHDQCVRTAKHGGHVLASAYCDDQFTSCIDDNTFAPSCKYDWRGTATKGNCPASFNGDGSCDCFCQFQDSDC